MFVCLKTCSQELNCDKVYKCQINPAKAQGPDGIPGWLLKENADLLVPPITDIINTSFREGRLPLSLKEADIAPVPKQRPIQDINKHHCPISLTPILSKIVEDDVVHDFVIPAVLKKINKRQYGTIPKSCTTHALVSMIHNWHVCSDGNSAVIRVVLFEPEFDPIWVNRQTLETVNSVKLLGLNISSDLRWNAHVSELVRKVSTQLYFQRQLKKSHVATRELLLFYITCIRSILQYGSPVFHRALPSYLSKDLERLQNVL